MEETKKRIEDLINGAQPETKKVIAEIFAIEKEKLYMSAPYRIADEIVEKIEELVR